MRLRELPLSAATLRLLGADERESWVRSLTPEQAFELQYVWRRFWARAAQLAPPGDWVTWLVLAGRGFGKTRTGAEWIREEVARGAKRIALVGPTAADVRDVMVEGPSGILECSPPWDRPVYEPSKRRVVWRNGAMATTFSADEPERLRGPAHDRAWCDEVAAWRYPEAWDNLMFGLRVGHSPRACATTTPKPVPLIRDLFADPTTATTGGSTYENRDNLAETFITRVVKKYEGTRLGQQELEAKLLSDVPGALWTLTTIDRTRRRVDQLPGVDQDATKDRRDRIRNAMRRIVVAIDPSGTKGSPSRGQSERFAREKSNDVGIVVCGKGHDGHGYVLEDLTCNLSPALWGQRAVDAYNAWHADKIIAEVNYGGAMVEATIRAVDPTVPFKEMRASRGKQVRAEPVAGLYERGECHNLGSFGELESQMTMMTSEGYVGGPGSPDRLDATVWGMTELMLTTVEPAPAVIGRASAT